MNEGSGMVRHESASHLVEVHILVVGPTPERPFRTLITDALIEALDRGRVNEVFGPARRSLV